MLFTRLRDFRPSVWGKISTFLQISTAVIVLGGQAFPELYARSLLIILFRLTTMAAIWSCIHYYWRGVRTITSGCAATVPQA